MARTAMVTRTISTKVYNVTYVTKAREFIEGTISTIKGEDINRLVEASKPDNSAVLSVDLVSEENNIYGIEVNKFFELSEEVNGRRGLVTKEFTFTTYKVVYVTKDRQFIEREVMVNEYNDIEEIAKNNTIGVVLSIEKVGEPTTIIVGMSYDKFITNAEKVDR